MEIKTHIRSNDWLDMHGDYCHGTHNGYIGVPPEHPWFKKNYNYISADVHGGLTFSSAICPGTKDPDGYWWIGFDTNHYNDTKFNCDEQYVLAQIESLKQQALAVIK